MIESEKNSLRKKLNSLRNSLTQEARSAADRAVCDILGEMDEINGAGVIAAYLPVGGEVSLLSFFRESAGKKKKFCFPRWKKEYSDTAAYEMASVPSEIFSGMKGACLPEIFSIGRFGFPEPAGACPAVDVSQISVWLVPGIGFDRNGNRLGYGAGIYDRMLAKAPGLKIGIGYDIQLVGKIPSGPFDRQMDLIVTEKGVTEVPCQLC
jgi:5-formyltetrahydrofolate cyclo-ligase